MDSIQMRPFNDESIMPEIMELLARELSEPYTIYVYRYFIHPFPQLTFCYYDKDKLIGVIIGKISLHVGSCIQTNRGYIAMLAVDQNYKRKGLATKLVVALVEQMKQMQVDEVTLEAEISNTKALALYDRLGFVRDKKLPKYYNNESDAYRLKLWFN